MTVLLVRSADLPRPGRAGRGCQERPRSKAMNQNAPAGVEDSSRQGANHVCR